MSALAVYDIELREKEFVKISELVYQHCGINLHAGKKELVRARLAKRLRLLNLRTFSEYIDYAVGDTSGDEFSILVDLLSTNLTKFFRESKHFEYLRCEFLPKLVERKKKRNSRRVRCWSAGCSSGEEPYSIAITLLENIEDQYAWDIKILATDISDTVLEKAQKGLYDKQHIEPIPNVLRPKYLTQIRDRGTKMWLANQNLRDIIMFRHLNLMSEWPIKGPVDFIFCRNVMIYFDKPTQQNLIGRFWKLLDSSGVLFTGHSESLTGIEHAFKYVQPTIYMKP
jgi:chemotaxis protein methyltransferase CheR